MMKMNMMMRTMMIMIPTGVVQDAMLDHTGSDVRRHRGDTAPPSGKDGTATAVPRFLKHRCAFYFL